MSAGYKNKHNYNKPRNTKAPRITERSRIDATTQNAVDKMTAEGISQHTLTNTRTPTTFLNDVKDYSDPNLSDRTNLIALTRKLRSVEGVCSSVADLLADFAITNGTYFSDNDELKILLNKWADFVNACIDLTNTKGMVFPTPGVRAFSRKVFDEYITDGDSIFTVFWQQGVKIDPTSTDSPMFLPTFIRTLDVTSLKIDSDLSKIGIERITLKLDDKIKDKILNPTTEADKYLKKLIPPTWMKFLNKKEDIVLDPNTTYHIKRNAKDWRPWGESLFIKAFGAIANKRRLQAVDASTIDGLLNRITVFKIGLADKEKNPAYHVPSTARVNSLIDLLTSPKRVNAIVWPGPDLEIEDIGPDGKILEFNEKYKQADTDILRALHVSPLLIDGGSSGQTIRDWAAFISTEVGLDYIRNELEKILTQIGKDIAVANGMEFSTLYYKFDTQLLKDEKKIRQFAAQVFEVGGISVETFVNTMGYDFTIEKMRKEKEKADGVDVLFSNPNRPGINPTEGRPDNTSNDDMNKESAPTTKPDNNPSAALSDDIGIFYGLYLSAFDRIRSSIGAQISSGVSDKSLVKMSLMSGFSGFTQLVNSQITSTFKKNAGGNITPELQVVLNWSKGYLDDFYSTLLLAMDDSIDSLLRTLNGSDYRIFLYAQESHVRAKWGGKIAIAKLSGKTTATVVISEDGMCEFSKAGTRDYDLDYLLHNFPSHPNCSGVITV